MDSHRKKVSVTPVTHQTIAPDDINSESTIDMRAFTHDASDQVKSAFNGLEPEIRSALYLKEFENLSYDEISIILDAHVSTIKSRIAKGRSVVRNQLVASGYFSINN